MSVITHLMSLCINVGWLIVDLRKNPFISFIELF